MASWYSLYWGHMVRFAPKRSAALILPSLTYSGSMFTCICSGTSSAQTGKRSASALLSLSSIFLLMRAKSTPIESTSPGARRG
ncbi:MAG: hypothetical protein RXP77_03145 [Nitrososphaeria archaeon]